MRLRPILAAVAAPLAAVLASAAPAAAAGDPILPLSQVRSGMHCTGYSVVRGTAISSFDVEVLDVVDGDPNENGPRILVQVSGPAVDSTGIGPGFSGSPIYCPGDDGVAAQHRRDLGVDRRVRRQDRARDADRGHPREQARCAARRARRPRTPGPGQGARAPPGPSAACAASARASSPAR